ncbi:MAG: ABC transporter permease [Euzebyales bacterium]|nr:ABC transporter permease [Euzebyales bacterium]MBA3622740.1 ABC transporter permease [Euzebyales bacterium]
MSIWAYVQRRWPELVELALEHAGVVLLSVAVATVISVVLASLAYRSLRFTGALLTMTNVVFVVPALSYFGVLIYVTGLGYRTTVIVLTLYAMLPIVRNTVTGLREVDAAVVRSAKGMGMGPAQCLLRVQLPLAWPVIMASVRVSTVMIVGIAAIAAYFSGPGLGAEIFGGLAGIGNTRAVAQAASGTIFIILVAFTLDAGLVLLGRLTTSKGLR